MRRKRPELPPSTVPAHLQPGSILCLNDPQSWRRQRREWFRADPFARQAAGLYAIDWLIETRQAIGLAPFNRNIN